jgi:hypothetical protein
MTENSERNFIDVIEIRIIQDVDLEPSMGTALIAVVKRIKSIDH